MLAKKLASKGAILIEGPKWCGKTTTAEQQANSILYMDNPTSLATNLEMAEIDASVLLDGDTPRLIDEWQLAPKLWDAIRFEIDHRREVGQFVLTGSAVPAEEKEIHHSGTGRFSWLTMRPMSLYESGESNGGVSLAHLFGTPEKIVAVNKLKIDDIAFLICRGGGPSHAICKARLPWRKRSIMWTPLSKKIFPVWMELTAIVRQRGCFCVHTLVTKVRRQPSEL